MVDGTSKTEFSRLLQTRRKQMQLTQAALARQVAVSPILISYYERGHRTPRYETAHKIAEALRLEGEDREQFLSSLKFPLESSPDVSALLDELIRVFSSSTTSATLKDKLAVELSSVLRDWREMQKKKVRWAVIPVAGWQARLLAPDATVHMIERVMSEAETTGIDQVLVVLAPSQERVVSEKLLDRKRRMRIRLAVQADQFGLGHAILAARRFLPQNESFAVILPDDDLEESCLESMIDLYSREKCCVIAVRHVEETDEDSYGMVSVKYQSGSICIIEDLQEKPLDKFPGQSLAIIGRYILTPDIFRALELTGANDRGEIELTDALRKIAETQPIFGHLYMGEVTSLSPSRRLLEKMILSRDKRAVEV